MTKYITKEDFKEYTGIDLIEELAGDSNPSNKADSFLFRVEVRMETFVEVNTYKRLDSEYRKFTDYQKLYLKTVILVLIVVMTLIQVLLQTKIP